MIRMDDIIKERWLKWNHNPFDEDMKCDLERIRGDEIQITDRFYKDLEFGTGGLRGVMGAGTNRMNPYTVARATQGYASFLKRHKTDVDIVIAYDSRLNSEKFARISAQVFAANQIHVHMFREIMPTPVLSFAIRELAADGGIVVTASHNPAEYNGYKVYGRDGCQLTNKIAEEITAEIIEVDIFEDILFKDFADSVQNGSISYIKDDVLDNYLQHVMKESLRDKEIDKSLSIIYSPLNGTGLSAVTHVLRNKGFSNLIIVEEQKEANGHFPTCPYPNPENPEAMALAIAYGEKTQSDLVIATDPDCDRAGIAVFNGKEYIPVTANETGLLLMEYIMEARAEKGTLPDKPVVLKTIVTTDLAYEIASKYDVEIIDVLTGFKYIGEQIGKLERQGRIFDFMFAFEESCGYLTGSYVRDKDGVNAALLICEMAAYYKKQKKTLLDVLNQLYKKYGYCTNTLKTYEFKGKSGLDKMKQLMDSIRAAGFDFFKEYTIVKISDFYTGSVYHLSGDVQKTGLPQSNAIKLYLSEGNTVVFRPSGTEPKLKVYFTVKDKGEKAKEIIADLVNTFERKWL